MKAKMFLAVIAFAAFFISCNSPETPDGVVDNQSQKSVIIQLDKTSFSFSGMTGQANPPSQSFQLRNSGSGELQYQIDIVGKSRLTVQDRRYRASDEIFQLQLLECLDHSAE